MSMAPNVLAWSQPIEQNIELPYRNFLYAFQYTQVLAPTDLCIAFSQSAAASSPIGRKVTTPDLNPLAELYFSAACCTG
jgi:hypothetical protein